MEGKRPEVRETLGAAQVERRGASWKRVAGVGGSVRMLGWSLGVCLLLSPATSAAAQTTPGETPTPASAKNSHQRSQKRPRTNKRAADKLVQVVNRSGRRGSPRRARSSVPVGDEVGKAVQGDPRAGTLAAAPVWNQTYDGALDAANNNPLDPLGNVRRRSVADPAASEFKNTERVETVKAQPTPVSDVSANNPTSTPLVVERVAITAPTYHHAKVRVSADSRVGHWTNTGLLVQEGQRLIIRASGSVTLNPGLRSTPAGIPNQVDGSKLPFELSSGKPMPKKPVGALIASIGEDGKKLIYVGDGDEIYATRSGFLRVGINENPLNDGDGSYEVSIEAEPYVSAPLQAAKSGSRLLEGYSALQFSTHTDAGALSEIKDKRRVYVYGAERKEHRRIMLDELAKYSGVELVETPERAEFAIIYYDLGTTLTGLGEPSRGAPTLQTREVGTMYVFVRGVDDAQGNYRPRVVWSDVEDLEKTNGLAFGRRPATNMSRHFINALKELRGEKR
jgi:hypothetical protein